MPEAGTDRLELLADPAAAGRARAWLKARLGDWSPGGVETVQLLVSELVTNALLHTDDDIEVAVERIGAGVRVDVIDRSPSKPVLKPYGRDAATGRGLRLVEALADGWGVHDGGDRKAVWFLFVDRASRSVGGTAAGLADWGDLETWPGLDGSPAARPDPGADDIEVRLCGLPVSLYLAAEEHHDALMRELALLLGGDTVRAAPGGRLMDLAAGLLAHFGAGNEQLRAQVDGARRAGEATVDVVMFAPVGGGDMVLSVADRLDEVDWLCEDARLLTPPSPPAVKRFRRWYSGEVARQLQGRTPSPWPFPLDEVR